MCISIRPPIPSPLFSNKQLKFMEMPVCNDDAAHKLGICLTKFFRELDGGNNNDDEPVDVKEKVVEETKETKPVVEETKPVKAVVTTEKVKPKAPSPRSVVAPSPPSRVVSPPSSSYATSRSSSSSNSSSSSWMSAKQSSATNNVYDARSSSQRRQDEMKNMFGSSGGGGGGGSSIKERMKAFNNESTVNFDPVHFAVRKNKEAKGKIY